MSQQTIERLTPDFIERIREKASELTSALKEDEYDAEYLKKNVTDRDTMVVMFAIQHLDDHGIDRVQEIDEKIVEKSAKQLVSSLKWRKKQFITGLSLSDFAREILRQGFFRTAVTGENRDKVTIVMDFGRHKRISPEINAMETAFFFVFTECFTMEQFAAGREVTVVFDHTNYSLMNMDSSFMLDYFSLMSTHYPTIITRILAYNLPWYLKPVVAVARAVLPARLMTTFSLVDRKSINEILSKEQIPVWMGGLCECQLPDTPNPKSLEEVADRYGVTGSDLKKLLDYYSTCCPSASKS